MTVAPILLGARPVATALDLELMRALRNLGRATMGHHRDEISPAQQVAWWEARDPERLRAWLYREPDRGMTVAFGLLRQAEDGKWWITLAVDPSYRGRGYGTEIHRHLAIACPADLWAEPLTRNAASVRAAKAAGFEEVDQQGEYTILVSRKPTGAPS